MHSVVTPQYQQNTVQSLTIYMYIHSSHFKFPNDEFEEKRRKKKKEVDFLACEMKFICTDKHFWIMFFFVAWSNLDGKNCVWGSCDWTTTSHAKMNLATEIHHTDFSYHCKDFKGKKWQVSEFYAGASSSKAIVASIYRYWDLSLFGGDNNRFLYPN